MLRRVPVFFPGEASVFGILRRSVSSCEASSPSRGWAGSGSGSLPLETCLPVAEGWPVASGARMSLLWRSPGPPRR